MPELGLTPAYSWSKYLGLIARVHCIRIQKMLGFVTRWDVIHTCSEPRELNIPNRRKGIREPFSRMNTRRMCLSNYFSSVFLDSSSWKVWVWAGAGRMDEWTDDSSSVQSPWGLDRVNISPTLSRWCHAGASDKWKEQIGETQMSE